MNTQSNLLIGSSQMALIVRQTLGVQAISCICITRFAKRKGAVVFEAKILSVNLNAYSELKTIKYLFFIPETRDLANISLPGECYTSTCGNRQETNIRTQDTLKRAALCIVLGNKFLFNACQGTSHVLFLLHIVQLNF